MLTREDAARIADAITALRPTWTQNRLMALMANPTIRARRQPKDVAAAFAWIALDPDTREPTRILESGPWWGTADASARSDGPAYRYTNPRDCRTCNQPESKCTRDGHEYAPAFNGLDRATPEQRAAVKAAAQQLARPLPAIETTTNPLRRNQEGNQQ